MSHMLTLEIPDVLYRALQGLGARDGRTPEDVGAAWLAATINRVANDPLLKLAGLVNTATPDLADRHDEYLAESLSDRPSATPVDPHK